MSGISNVFYVIFTTLASIVSIYSTMCFIRIILTWIPQLSYSKFAQVLASITDPYLNLFRRIRWLQLGGFDFSPAIGFALLTALSSIFSRLARMQYFSVGQLLAMFIMLAWSIASSIIVFILILFIIRFIIILVRHQDYYYGNPIMETIDRSIAPLAHNISKLFTAGKKITYKTALIISSVVMVVVLAGGGILFQWLASLVSRIPF